MLKMSSISFFEIEGFYPLEGAMQVEHTHSIKAV